jgi:hypothetical protein
MDYAPTCCFALRSLLMRAFLPRGDESAMNLEAVGISLAALFPSSGCEGCSRLRYWLCSSLLSAHL